LVAIAAALRGDGVSAAAPVPRMVDDHAHQQRQGENSTDAAVRRSGESVLWAERRQRKAAEERLVTAQARIAALEAALAAAELPLPPMNDELPIGIGGHMPPLAMRSSACLLRAQHSTALNTPHSYQLS
jgi:hypothetical protein